MPPPPFAELRRVQKLIDHSLPGIRSLVLQKCSDLFASRRQTDQLKMDSPEQRRTIGIGRRLQIRRFQLGQDEGVDRRPRPIERMDRRRRIMAQWAKGPVRSTRDGVRRVSLVPFFRRLPLPGIRRAQLDPLFEPCHGLLGEGLVGWHPQVRIRVSHGPDQQTGIWISRYYCRALFASLRPSRAAVEQQSTLLLFAARRVTGVAALGQQRANVLFKVGQAFFCRSILGA